MKFFGCIHRCSRAIFYGKRTKLGFIYVHNTRFSAIPCNKDDSILPVLIVGAGPVGLVLSLLLTKLGKTLLKPYFFCLIVCVFCWECFFSVLNCGFLSKFRSVFDMLGFRIALTPN